MLLFISQRVFNENELGTHIHVDAVAAAGESRAHTFISVLHKKKNNTMEYEVHAVAFIYRFIEESLDFNFYLHNNTQRCA